MSTPRSPIELEEDLYLGPSAERTPSIPAAPAPPEPSLADVVRGLLAGTAEEWLAICHRPVTVALRRALAVEEERQRLRTEAARCWRQDPPGGERLVLSINSATASALSDWAAAELEAEMETGR